MRVGLERAERGGVDVAVAAVAHWRRGVGPAIQEHVKGLAAAGARAAFGAAGHGGNFTVQSMMFVLSARGSCDV